MERFAAIDFETANWKRSSICSVGIVIVEGKEIVEEIYSLVRPRPNYYMKKHISIHGITPEDTADAPDFETVWEQIAPRLQDLPLIAHNSTFDEGCLKDVFQTYDLAYPKYQFYCTYRMARRMYPYLFNHKLNTVSAHCGFDLMNHHHALADAQACAHIAVTMMEQQGVNSLEELALSLKRR
ncbi:MAG: 3'-5' exonuclease [Tannerellaceae bacterium]|nr:3'-5' exonuclease [Tannerellaceae bacterium]